MAVPTRAPPADETSQGGWSDPGTPIGGTTLITPGGAQPADASPARYAVGALLGRGGMGVVYAARDNALGRDVAFKELRPDLVDNALAAARLAREAAITSRLDHPGIVAVHDVGTLADGRPFYTMRLVRGQTLARAAADASTPDGRRQLVRRVLAAADAVAAAHDAGIVHRDLKPANILIGAHGETQVVDWGLATPTAAAAARWSDLPETGGHGPVGTDAYMAPEQARGDPPEPRHDVWSLGVTLSRVFGEADDLPVEIAAIVARAVAREPQHRYPDAAAFADDLLRWFEGRRVLAFAYTPGDLLRRTLRAYRLPLLVGAVGLAAVGLVVSVGFWQTTRSLGRALVAEADAADKLADLQLERAVEATNLGDRERAERLALSVLQRREDPLARGVFAAFGRAERPVRLTTTAGPTCLWSAVSATHGFVICGHADRIERWAAGRSEWQAPIAAIGGRIRAGHLIAWDAVGTTTLLDLDSGGLAGVWQGSSDWRPESPPRRVWTDLGALPVPTTPPSPCYGNLRVVDAPPGGRIASVCGDGRLFLGTLDDPTHVVVPTDFVGDHVAVSLAWMPGDRVAVGSLRGKVAVYEGRSGDRVAHGLTSLGSLGNLAVSADGNVLALGGTVGGVGLWQVDTAALIGDIPAPQPRSFVFTGEGLLVHDGSLNTWRIPTGAPALVRTTAGLADVTVDGAGTRIALACGDGGVWTVGLADGRVQRRQVGDRVVKATVFSADGSTLFASGLAPPQLASMGAGEGVSPVAGGRPFRRLASATDGSLVGVDMDPGLYRWPVLTDTPALLAPERGFSDIERDGDTVVVLDGHGAVERLDGLVLTLLTTVPDARAVAVRGDRLAIARPDGVEVHDGAQPRFLDAAGATLVDVALSPDGRRVAAVGLDTTVRVWNADTGEQIGLLPGHEERVVAVEFLPDGDLVTASWDKTARIWSLGALTEPVASLAQDVVAAWGEAPR